MSDTPIYDRLKYEIENPNWAVERYHDYLLKSKPGLGIEKQIRERQGWDQNKIKQNFASRVHERRVSKYNTIHNDFRQLYGRKAYKQALKTGTVVD